MSVDAVALSDALRFLKDLPRRREQEPTAWARLAAFRAAHPGLSADLVIDLPPGSEDVDFDLLLRQDDTGSVAIGWRPDRGDPWSVQYSEHWASNLVLSVNDVDLTIQDALLALRLGGGLISDLSKQLVDHCLIVAEILRRPPDISDEEAQGAADAFRLARGLGDSECTQRWLSESGLTLSRFEELIKTTLQLRKLKEGIPAQQARAFFEAHKEDFATVTLLRLQVPSDDVLPGLEGSLSNGEMVERLLSACADNPSLSVSIESGFATYVLRSLPAATSAPEGSFVGPGRNGGEYWCGRILRRCAPAWDPRSLAFVREHLFEAWLAEERAKARIVWHWL